MGGQQYVYSLEVLNQRTPGRTLDLVHKNRRSINRRIEALLPEVDLFVGTESLGRLPDLLADEQSSGAHLERIDPHGGHAIPRILTTPPGSAYIKVSEGCSNRCSRRRADYR